MIKLTPELLIALGFLQVPHKTHRYTYRGIKGTLEPVEGLFFFDGFGHPISKLANLEFMLMLIDHHDQASLAMFQTPDN